MGLLQQWVVVCSLAGLLFAYQFQMSEARDASGGFDAERFDLEEFLTADVGAQKRDDIKRLVVHRQLLLDKMEEDDACTATGEWLGKQLETFGGTSTEDYLRLLCEVEPMCYKSFGIAFRDYFVQDLAQKPKPGKKEPYMTVFGTEVPFSQAIDAAPVIVEYFCSALADPLGLY